MLCCRLCCRLCCTLVVALFVMMIKLSIIYTSPAAHTTNSVNSAFAAPQHLIHPLPFLSLSLQIHPHFARNALVALFPLPLEGASVVVDEVFAEDEPFLGGVVEFLFVGGVFPGVEVFLVLALVLTPILENDSTYKKLRLQFIKLRLFYFLGQQGSHGLLALLRLRLRRVIGRLISDVSFYFLKLTYIFHQSLCHFKILLLLQAFLSEVQHPAPLQMHEHLGDCQINGLEQFLLTDDA